MIKQPMERTQIIDLCNKKLECGCTPDQIAELKPNEVLVFGSKPNGNHKGGAAKLAVEKYGAVEGQVEGFSGQSYAIPVHTHHTNKMDQAVKTFIYFAKTNPDKQFVVLPVGCGSAGMDVRRVAEMFSLAIHVNNIMLPQSFIYALIENRNKCCEIQFTDYPDYYILTRWLN